MGIPGPRGAPICIARSLAEVKFENTAEEKTLASQSIAGAKAGDIYTFRAFGTRLNNSAETKSFRLRLYLGATSLLDTGSVNFAINAEIARWRVEARIFVPTLATQVVEGPIIIGGPSASSWALSTTGQFVGEGYATAAEDMSAAKTLKLATVLGAASAEIRSILKGWTLHRERA